MRKARFTEEQMVGSSVGGSRAGIGGDQAGGQDTSVMGWIGRAAEGLPSPLGRYFRARSTGHDHGSKGRHRQNTRHRSGNNVFHVRLSCG